METHNANMDVLQQNDQSSKQIFMELTMTLSSTFTAGGGGGVSTYPSLSLSLPFIITIYLELVY